MLKPLKEKEEYPSKRLLYSQAVRKLKEVFCDRAESGLLSFFQLPISRDSRACILRDFEGAGSRPQVFT